MALDAALVRGHLREFDLIGLFNELGWDQFSQHLPISVSDEPFDLRGVAEKRGVQIFECRTTDLPDYATRKKIEQKVKDYAFEHLIIFTDTAQTTQIWQWVARQTGQRTAYREHTYHKGYADEALIQKLNGIVFYLNEEEGITLDEVNRRLKDEFDKDALTKKFYECFKKEHDAFLKFVQGIQAQGDREWYASVMLNRLMFVYFIQQKGFLDGDTDYLQNRLYRLKKTQGDDRFYSFYRTFLLRLFHEGLGGRARAADIEQLLGKIPYLNGGLFDVHALEAKYTDIQIPDEAFENIFKFFDQYNWHLDERPLREDNEINPDVLGYIFEKYINQKQMGAYYTKEDITDYISKNTVIPFILDSAQKNCKIAFEGESSVWRLLQNDPDRYIYEAVKKGVYDADGNERVLPPEIAVGIDDVRKRDTWNTPAPAEYALPTEIWREVVARRQRYEEVRSKLANGEVKTVSDLITYNLDIIQFMQDVLENAEGPELVRAVWLAVAGRTPEPGTSLTYQAGISVLDPTCGSGAFLFAALNILKPIYEACLDRMESFVSDAGRSGETNSFRDFQRILNRVAKHPNRDYFILKSIILDNLYGVDIMEEAVEIAKLRLFLKLAAQIDPEPSKPNYGIEPLPDIDFNIRAGNTLVGYASYQEIKEAIEGKEGSGQLIRLDIFDAMTPISEKAAEVERLFKMFRQQQIIAEDNDTVDTAATKAKLRERLKGLEDELNTHLARDYGVNVDKAAEYKKWLDSHEPFHWYTEFYGIMDKGGFDVIVGNPPYVEYKKISKVYTVLNLLTEDAGNLYAFIGERSLLIAKQDGYVSLIIPISSFSTPRALPFQEFWLTMAGKTWLSHFGVRPAKLFTGADQRVTISISKLGSNSESVFSSRYLRWTTAERDVLLQKLQYEITDSKTFAKFGSELALKVSPKLKGRKLEYLYDRNGGHVFYWHRIPQYFIKAIDFEPYFYSDRDGHKRSEDYKIFPTKSKGTANAAMAILNSSLAYWFWMVFSEGYHFGKHEVLSFPAGYEDMDSNLKSELDCLAQKLMTNYQDNLIRKSRKQKSTNVSYDEFQQKLSKELMDGIDTVLAQHYNFTAEELDFIINYDIKYRMGDELFDD